MTTMTACYALNSNHTFVKLTTGEQETCRSALVAPLTRSSGHTRLATALGTGKAIQQDSLQQKATQFAPLWKKECDASRTRRRVVEIAMPGNDDEGNRGV